MSAMEEVLLGMPYRLRTRFEWIGAYVTSVIEEERNTVSHVERLTRAEVQLVQLEVLSQYLDMFFRDGTAAAIKAVDVLNMMGVRGFSIGSSTFRGRNKEVMRGNKLSQSLRKTVTNISSQPGTVVGIRELTLKVIRRVRHARGLH